MIGFEDKIFGSFVNEAGNATQSMIDEIAKLTKANDHFEARIQVAGMMGNKELEDIYKSLKTLHDKYNNPYAIKLRDDIEKDLYKAITKKWKNWKDMKMAL